MATKKNTKESKSEVAKESPAPKNVQAKKTAPEVEVQTPPKRSDPIKTTSKAKKGFAGKLVIALIACLIGLILVFISVVVTYLLTAKWEGDKSDEKFDSLDLDYQKCLASLDGYEEDLDECQTELDNIEEPVCDCTDIEGPVQTIRIGDHGSLRIPSGWMLAGVNSGYRYLTDAEETDMIKPENNGLWPIYESTEYSLAVSEDTGSVLTITESGLFVPGATGFMPDELTGDYKVLSQEKNDEDELAVRVYDGSDYIYLLVYANPDYQSADPVMYSADVKYLYFDLNYPSIVYSGSTKYLEDADQIFIESCLRDSTKLCNGSIFE